MSRSPSNRAAVILVMMLVPGTWTAHGRLLAAEPESPAASQPTAASSPASAPATTRQAPGGDTSRILTNFANMMKGNWKSLAAFAATTVLNAVLWAIGSLLAGILAGLASYFILRRFRLFDATWPWYRFVRWLWPVVFILSAAAGFTYSGAWIGMGRNIKSYIRQKRMLDKIVGHVYFAIVLDEAGYQATGQESAEKLEQVLADSEAIGKLAMADWAIAREKLTAFPARSPLERWLVHLALRNISDDLAEQLRGLDPRLVMVFFGMHPNIDQYLREHPDANAMIAALSVHLEPVRQKACDMVDSVVRPQAAVGIAAGLLGPALLLGIFCVVVHLAGGRPGRSR